MYLDAIGVLRRSACPPRQWPDPDANIPCLGVTIPYSRRALGPVFSASSTPSRIDTIMKSLLALFIACGALLSGCVVAPYDDHGGGQGNGGCPPGQAKKGNCRVDQYGNESFCPPGQAKKGRC